MMKYRREMTAEQHLIVLEDKGEIKVKDNKIIVFTDDDGGSLASGFRLYGPFFSQGLRNLLSVKGESPFLLAFG